MKIEVVRSCDEDDDETEETVILWDSSSQKDSSLTQVLIQSGFSSRDLTKNLSYIIWVAPSKKKSFQTNTLLRESHRCNVSSCLLLQRVMKQCNRFTELELRWIYLCLKWWEDKSSHALKSFITLLTQDQQLFSASLQGSTSKRFR